MRMSCMCLRKREVPAPCAALISTGETLSAFIRHAARAEAGRLIEASGDGQ